MKKFFSFLTVALLATLSLGVSSCSDDSDEPENRELWKGELAPAAYASDAALFMINSDGIKSIELTGSGLYFVTPASMNYPYSKTFNLLKKTASRASDTDGLLSGRFTKIGENSYDLNGYGILRIENDKLEVETTGGAKYIWTYTRQPQIKMDALNNRLCRTWKIKAARIEFLDKNDNVVGTFNYSNNQIVMEFVNYFTFTRAGRTYEYDDGEWYGGSWEWQNSKNQILTVVPDNEDDGGAICQIFFNNDDITIAYPEFIDGEELGINIPSTATCCMTYLTCTNYIP